MYQGEAVLPNHCWSAVSDPGNTTGMRGVKKKKRGAVGGKTWNMRIGMVPLGNSAQYHPTCNFSPNLGNFASKDKRQCFFSS